MAAGSVAQVAYEAFLRARGVPEEDLHYARLADQDKDAWYAAAAAVVRDQGSVIPPHNGHLESDFCPAGCPRLEAVRALLRDRALRPAVNEVSNRQRAEPQDADRLERLTNALPEMRAAVDAFDEPKMRRIAFEALLDAWLGDNR